MQAYKVVKIAKYILLAYRLLLQVFIGKKRRDIFLKKRISYLDFLPLFYGNRMVESHEGFKAIPRLNTDDFTFYFKIEKWS